MKYENDEVRKLANVLDVIARKCWRGLPALMGLEPQPTREQIKEAFFFRPSPDAADLGIKVQGGGSLEGREIAQEDTMIDEIDAVLAAVPWAEIVKTVQWYAREYPVLWAMYKKYIVNQETIKIGWGREGALSRTASAFDASEYQIKTAVRCVPYKIAQAVSMGLCADEALQHSS